MIKLALGDRLHFGLMPNAFKDKLALFGEFS